MSVAGASRPGEHAGETPGYRFHLYDRPQTTLSDLS